MAEKKKPMKLRTVNELSEAGEWLWNNQREGQIDSKAADGLNTTLKNQIYLNVKLRMDLLKIFVSAKIKKIDIPQGMIPDVEGKAAITQSAE